MAMAATASNKHESDAASDTSSVHSGEPSDRGHRDVDFLTQVLSTRSEEYRLLFRLPPDEVLVQDFNCALQENILLQGHMYLFVHHICFYSNIFGFETKRSIPFHEVTFVRKAKTAGIFPNALEIVTDAKKHFFGSFLSRDEAYRLIMDGWSQHNSDGKAFLDHQESKCDSSIQDSSLLMSDSVGGSKELTDLNSADSLLAKLSEDQENEVSVSCLSPGESLTWHLDDVDSPKVPEYFTMVAEAKFPVNLEDFFHNFFSDAAAEFFKTFRITCGDKDFWCTPWRRHEQFGHARNLSFDHPIKIYFGAKFGHCQERQRFRAYRDGHLIIETSQQISDVPYGDYFHVEGFWDVEECKEDNSCTVKVYINLAFSRKTIWKGKIEQSTKEECRDVYAIWINNADELLKQKSLGIDEGVAHRASNISPDNDVGLESSPKLEGHSERSNIMRSPTRTSQIVPDLKDLNLQINRYAREVLRFTTSVASIFRGPWTAFCSCLKNQTNSTLILVLTFGVILILMQLSTIVLLAKSPEVHIISQGNSMGGHVSERAEIIDWLETRVHHLSEEMLIMETRLERMRNEYVLLRTHLQDFQLIKHKI